MAETGNLTTEQMISFTFAAEDGRERLVMIDGTPTWASSDETIATVANLVVGADGKTWSGNIVAGAMAGVATITITADADISPAVNNVIGVAQVSVTVDKLTSARIAKLTLGAPQDKPA